MACRGWSNGGLCPGPEGRGREHPGSAWDFVGNFLPSAGKTQGHCVGTGACEVISPLMFNALKNH